MLGPRLAQVNDEISMLSAGVASQLSVEPLSTSAAAMLAFPVASRFTVISLQRATGGRLSTTVMVVVHSSHCPPGSVTLTVTELPPIPAQLNVLGVTVVVRVVAQLSAEPDERSLRLSWSSTQLPEASNATVMGLHTALGGVLSTTVTEASQVEVFPLMSVTVSVMVWVPASLQSKSVWLAEYPEIPQASLLPAFRLAGLRTACPRASSVKVALVHKALGGVTSCTVTTASQIAVFPLPSVTVRVTVLVPTSAQSKTLGETERVTGPLGSVEPAPMAAISSSSRV